jgi:type IV secretion system protein VirB6
MVQNAMMVAGLRSVASSRGGAATAAGGVVRAGTGMPYAAGHAAGTAARVVGDLAARAGGRERTPAYRRAAERGRRW